MKNNKYYFLIALTFLLSTSFYTNEENEGYYNDINYTLFNSIGLNCTVDTSLQLLPLIIDLLEVEDKLSQRYSIPFDQKNNKYIQDLMGLVVPLYKKHHLSPPKEYQNFIQHELVNISDNLAGWSPIILYENDNYGGGSVKPLDYAVNIIFGDYDCYQCRKVADFSNIGGNWNDKISSGTIRPNEGADLSVYIFYEDVNFSGRKKGFIMTGNDPTTSIQKFRNEKWSWSLRHMNDRISSMTALNIWYNCNQNTDYEACKDKK